MLVERKIPREKNLNMSKSVGKIVAFERKRESSHFADFFMVDSSGSSGSDRAVIFDDFLILCLFSRICAHLDAGSSLFIGRELKILKSNVCACAAKPTNNVTHQRFRNQIF